ncbi:MAG: MoxR family ATPase [Chloroflexi bacterium]|nr:MoxR family ATPase [Chloroflexota bacterium]
MTVQEFAQKIVANVGQVVIGKKNITELALIALLCEGHILFEDVPGIGKTTLAKTLARSLGCDFARIQFTPDLLPSDVTGIFWYNQKTQSFEFRPGPIMGQMVLADEINRATPRTQSALLEAMQERQITVDRDTFALPQPFLVMATQNPIELEGTFPLPEAQVDRFLIKTSLGYPTAVEEDQLLLRYARQDPLIDLEPVVDAADILAMQQLVRQVRVEDVLRGYMVQVVRATREHPAVDLGVSPRGSLALYRTAQAYAAIRGRDYVLPDDVKAMTPYVLTHRIHISPQTRLRGRTPSEVIAEVINEVEVPVFQ